MNHSGMNVADKDWVGHMLLLSQKRAFEAKGVPAPPLVRPGSLWVRRPTELEPVPPRRRGTILWASEAQVCLSFDETNTNARKVHTVPDFLRLYSEV